MHLLRSLAEALGYRLIQPQEHNTLEEHLKQLLPALGVSCVVDVGANAGQYGSKLRSYGYRGRIVSFEPLAEPFAQLAKRASGDPDWRASQLALGAEAGTRDIHVTRSTQFASFRPPSEYGERHFPSHIRVERSESVRVSTLDAEWPRIVEDLAQPAVYLKVDTQGSDLEVLAGATAILPHVAALQTELSFKALYEGVPGYLDTLSALHDLGFEPTGFFPITREPERLSLIETDCVMTRRR